MNVIGKTHRVRQFWIKFELR